MAGGLPLPRVLDLAIPLADALVAAHQGGVVHRDLKPANVMVTHDGRVKVLDFGLAKFASRDSKLNATQTMTAASPISTAGQVVGTVPYMAPEQLRGEAVDAQTDLFALGIIVYELVTGRRPFEGATSADVSPAILRDVPALVRSLRGDMPRDLERIIGTCLEKNPRDRYQTARDVYNELRYLSREMERRKPTLAPAPSARQSPSTGTGPDRGAAVREPQPQRGRRVLRGRARGRAAERAGKDSRPAGRGAHLVVPVQGEERGPGGDRAKAECRHRARG